MKVRAKFRCDSVAKNYQGIEIVDMTPAVSDSEANKTWSQYTPSGNLKMMITAAGAIGQFVPGNYYLLDFTEATKDD